MKSPILLAVIFYTAILSNALHTEKIFQNPCISQLTCHECIQRPTCVWCYDPNFGNQARCLHPAMSSNSICREEYMWNPDNEIMLLVNRELSKVHSSSSSSSSRSGFGSKDALEIVQISPQRVNMKLRINEAFRLQIHYTQAEDYPIDVYYLIDRSKSMEDEKDKLSNLGNLLAESIQGITSNFRLGFGSFIVPNTSNTPKELETPYGFRNHMSLSSNTSQFATMVKNITLSENLDVPEGGFNAIMKAIVRSEIGWRGNAKKILVFSTNAGLHYAENEKFDGVLKPINVIFAVTEDKIQFYVQLQTKIEGAVIGKLSVDSTNVIDLIKDEYQKISSSVEMKNNEVSGIRVSYYSQCLNIHRPTTRTNKCNNIKVGNVITFSVEIEVIACPKDPKDWKQTLQIYPVGINESLIVDLEMLCACPCEHPGHSDYKVNTKECSGNGIYKCGICECNPAYFGRHCECSAIGGTEIDYTQSCRPDNVTTVVCSGKGNCVCGKCKCDLRENPKEIIFGSYCECDNFSCDRHEGVLCSGPDHGECECGKCKCLGQWSGSECSCHASNDNC